MFKGSFPALVTPFKNGAIDEDAFQSFVNWQITNGSHGLVPCGTTGESPTLTVDEHRRVIELCIEAVQGRCPVIAGAGSNVTADAVDMAQHAQKLGADAILAVTPYYNKPTQEGIFQHYKTMNDALDIPIILYNVPSRTGVNIELETLYRLAELPRVAGIKDASPDLARPLQMRKTLGADFCLLSGEDATAIPYLAQGGDGCISVTANIAPNLCANMHNAWNEGNISDMNKLNQQLIGLHDAMFCESNPAPVKYGLSRLDLMTDELRLPLMAASPAARTAVDEALKATGLLK